MENNRRKPTRITRKLLIDSLVWNCHNYVRDGISSRCEQGGVRTNCVREKCSRVNDIFRTMQEIQDGSIVVF